MISGLKPLRVAHGGGGLNNKACTNSFEALTSNYSKGFLYFELDFVFTQDDSLVCLHDWKKGFKQTFGFKSDKKITLKEFEQLIENNSEFTNCTLDGLAVWMRDNPLAYIITDIKEDNIKALKLIVNALPNAKRRVMPQIYQPQDFNAIKEIGFEAVIWTLYRFSGTNDEVMQWVNHFRGAIAITMPKSRAESSLPKLLSQKHVPTYVHTVNTIQEFKKLTNVCGVCEVYTDFLDP